MTDPTPLKLATTDDLLTELASRFRSSLFVAIDSKSADDENQWYERKLTGHPFEVYGLACHAAEVAHPNYGNE